MGEGAAPYMRAWHAAELATTHARHARVLCPVALFLPYR